MTLHLKWYGEKAKDSERAGTARGLMLGAEHVLEEANRIVPIEDGDLLRSGHPWPPEQVGLVGGEGMQAAVTYDTPYAVRQHEELDYHHDVGRKAKYLETPINDAGVKAKVEELIAREIKAALG
jgi:hypothetical protein